ncbi:hypothetical protein NMG60_11002397 [Bertholletia excelsa]
MGRSPCCVKEGLNRGAWTAIEDKILVDYITVHGEGKWRSLPKRAGLKRCGKSCRLRWMNYLRPDIKRGNITRDEEDLIIRLHKLLGNRWSLIAGRLPGRTDNEIKNYWNTNIGKKVQGRPTSAANRRSSSSSIQPKDNQIQPFRRSHSETRSHVVRTKASRCTRVFISPELDQQFEAKTKTGQVGPNPHYVNASGPFIGSRDNEPSDFMMDFEMDDRFLSDFLGAHHDFAPLSELNADADTNASFSSVGFHDSDLQSAGTFLEDWLREQD